MKSVNYVLGIFFSCIFLIGCGKKEEKKKEGFTYEDKTSIESKPEPEVNENDVVITGSDLMKFNKTEIKVKADKKVIITLKNIGKLDKYAMGHNFVLLKQGVDLTAFGNKAATASSNDYIPLDTKDVIAHTKIIGGGETASVEFDAPKPGVYEFLCSFPGHYTMMKGKFIVE